MYQRRAPALTMLLLLAAPGAWAAVDPVLPLPTARGEVVEAPAGEVAETAATGKGARATAAALTVEAALQPLIDEALLANLELRAGDASVEQRIAALDQARARYLPVLDFSARYTVADGGRTIDFAVGQLLNPVYETLDQMLVANGEPARFPRVHDESIALLRAREQETRFTVEQPLYEPRIGPAIDANRAQVERAEADLSALRSRVIRDTKQAYYTWLASIQAVAVLDATLEAARANLGANESLYRNGRVTRDLVYRAEADVLEVEQSRLSAVSRVRIARSYVNLLRNAPLTRQLPETAVDEATVQRFRARFVSTLAGRRLDAPLLQDLAASRRQELRSLDAAIVAGEAQQDLARAAFKPMLALGAEAGIQGEDYGFGVDEKYVLASLVLRWNAFRGGADKAALREAHALTSQLRATRDLASQRVQLEVQQALENLEVADASLDTAARRTDAAAGAFRIISRKRDQGQINQAEFIDARRAYTDAALNLNRVRAEFLGRLAELEFAVGSARRLDEEHP